MVDCWAARTELNSVGSKALKSVGGSAALRARKTAERWAHPLGLALVAPRAYWTAVQSAVWRDGHSVALKETQMAASMVACLGHHSVELTADLTADSTAERRDSQRGVEKVARRALLMAANLDNLWVE